MHGDVKLQSVEVTPLLPQINLNVSSWALRVVTLEQNHTYSKPFPQVSEVRNFGMTGKETSGTREGKLGKEELALREI